MKKYYTLVVFIFLLSDCKKDDSPTIENLDSFTIENFENVSDRHLNAQDVELLDDQSLIIVGNGNGESSSVHSPYFLKIDSDNSIIDLKFLDFDQRNIFRKVDIFRTEDNNYMYLSQSTEWGSTNADIDIRKLTDEGQLIWKQSIGSESKYDQGISITEIPNGDFIILSKENENEDEYSLNRPLLTRISSDGELIWSKSFEEYDLYKPKKVLYSPNDNSILALNEYDFGISTEGKIQITKFDLDGNILSTKRLLENQQYWSLSANMKLLDDGKILAYFSNDGSNDYEIQVKILNEDLTEIWSKNYNQIEADLVVDAIKSSNGGYLILSQSSRINDSGFDIILLKIDDAGDIIWRKSYDSGSSDQGGVLVEKANGNIIILGHSNHNKEADGNFDLFLLETDAEGNPI